MSWLKKTLFFIAKNIWCSWWGADNYSDFTCSHTPLSSVRDFSYLRSWARFHEKVWYMFKCVLLNGSIVNKAWCGSCKSWSFSLSLLFLSQYPLFKLLHSAWKVAFSEFNWFLLQCTGSSESGLTNHCLYGRVISWNSTFNNFLRFYMYSILFITSR